jgi:antitoxin (DNA-binding transcriptional repressor) of toxin-antitoxin stability system
MYVVKRYTTALLRERLAEALDAAERGEGVFIERRGVTFTIQPHEPRVPPRRRTPSPVVELVDPAVRDGTWTWQTKAAGLSFKRRRA